MSFSVRREGDDDVVIRWDGEAVLPGFDNTVRITNDWSLVDKITDLLQRLGHVEVR